MRKIGLIIFVVCMILGCNDVESAPEDRYDGYTSVNTSVPYDGNKEVAQSIVKSSCLSASREQNDDVCEAISERWSTLFLILDPNLEGDYVIEYSIMNLDSESYAPNAFRLVEVPVHIESKQKIVLTVSSYRFVKTAIRDIYIYDL